MIEQLRNKVRESVAKKMKKSRIMIPDMVERETERFDTLIVPELERILQDTGWAGRTMIYRSPRMQRLRRKWTRYIMSLWSFPGSILLQ